MLSLRSIARSAPRTVSRLAAQSSCHQLPALRTSTLLQSSWRQPVTSRLAASFSTTQWRRQSDVNDELVAKLEKEISLEKDMRDAENYTPNVKEYLDSSAYEVHDAPGQEEVVLTRKFNDESIRITFSIADLNNMDSNPEAAEEDRAMYDEYEDTPENAQSGGANTKGANNQGRTSGGNIKIAPEDEVAPADRPELQDEYPEDEGQPGPAFPARMNIRITRDGKIGAMTIEAVAQDGDIIIDNVFYFPEGDLADPKTAEHDWKRRIVYAGPPFGNLDEDLQVLLERYLEERGIDTKLALFVPDYIDFKEQKEYLRWLSNIQSFLKD